MNDLKQQLAGLNNFQECIIEDVKFSNYLTCVEFLFNYIWNSENKVRMDLDQKKWIILKINSIQEFKMLNFAFQSNIEKENLNWSHCEISMIRVKSENELEILWESDRKIEIKFNGEIEIRRNEE